MRYEAAISSSEYDTTSARLLADRVRARLADAGAIWTREPAAAVLGGALPLPADAARTVVVLHGRMWGRTPATRDDRVAIEQRLGREGPGFVRVLLLDDAPPPAWAAPAASVVAAAEIDDCVNVVVGAIREQGGLTRTDAPAEVAARAVAVESRSRERDAFLGSHRSALACTRERDRRGDEIERRAASLATDGRAGKVDIQRAPGRCMVQIGDVALTLSWIRAQGDLVAGGRLMIIEWAGIVRRGTDKVPERAGARAAGQPPAALWEDVMLADATAAGEWRWRREGTALGWYTSQELGALCVDTLAARLRENGGE
ncbi:MAG TPA: hypothetical protein VNA89_00210 [Gemmatimonadaceae bacterium]|nr:hypothetical protein [Gemmatimonadaceae bacterium]